MRIIIEFEGTEATVKSAQTGPVATQVPAGPAPSEVLAAAAALGALDAGPAPNVGAQLPGEPALPPPITGPGAPIAGIGALDAGSAPNVAAQPSVMPPQRSQ